jgi:hypothetical protein
VNGQKLKCAHRVAYYLHNGIVPAQLVLHSCDNPPCCNPLHLRQGSSHDNKQDAVSRNRHAFGEKINTHKLTPAQVQEIRQLSVEGKMPLELSQKYGVNRSTIARIKTGQFWKSVT